ncbi:MAG: pirin family protein [Myxococcota bacterium]
MLEMRPAGERGYVSHGWLDARHTFSFEDYYDPRYTGWRCIRVINDDKLAPGSGFGMHPHKDVEILSYVVNGALLHRDSLGNRAVLTPGELSVMNAGRGIIHSEFNASDTEPLRFLQIWLVPEVTGVQPSYQRASFAQRDRHNRLLEIASPAPREETATINQDVRVSTALLEPGARVHHPFLPGRHAWVQVVRGSLTLNGVAMQEGDGAGLHGEQELELVGKTAAEVLMLDVP